MALGQRDAAHAWVVLVGAAVCACLQIAGSRDQIPMPRVPAGLPLSPTSLYPYLVLPSLVVLASGRSPLRYLRPGAWDDARSLVPWIAAGSLVAVYVVWRHAKPIYLAQLTLTLFCVEFFFRGFLVLELLPFLGRLAIPVATLPYAVVHANKPVWELFGSIVFGLAVGHLAARTGSILYGFAFHVLLAAMSAAAFGQ